MPVNEKTKTKNTHTHTHTHTQGVFCVVTALVYPLHIRRETKCKRIEPNSLKITFYTKSIDALTIFVIWKKNRESKKKKEKKWQQQQ